MDGSKPGPLSITPDQLTYEVWNYILRKKPFPENSKIPKEKLDRLREEFEYWYPFDLRTSGKDLIRNHLTMSLYNHAAIWEDTKMMPKSFYCNGHIMVNGKKMSKSAGNFLSIEDCIKLYSADATRMTLADAGDGLDDANFDEKVANSLILRLYTFRKWITDIIYEVSKKASALN
jgi:leucyl-tRNA synthetase